MARPFFLSFMKKLEADPTLSMNKNSVFKLPDSDLIVTDCSQYETKESHKASTDRMRKVKVLRDEFDDEFN